MATDDSLNPPPASEFIRRWSEAMEQGQYDLAVTILDEGLQAAARENNAEEITHYTNLKEYTHNIVQILASHKERKVVIPTCSMCGKGEADGTMLVAGADIVICDGCIKLCVGVLDTQRRELGKGFDCSFCGRKQAEAFKIIAGPGVAICDNCVKICTEILASDSD